MPRNRLIEALALHYDIPLAAALLLTACATPQPNECVYRQMDVAAAEACLAETACAAKWGSPAFRAQLDDNLDYVAQHCAVRP